MLAHHADLVTVRDLSRHNTTLSSLSSHFSLGDRSQISDDADISELRRCQVKGSMGPHRSENFIIKYLLNINRNSWEYLPELSVTSEPSQRVLGCYNMCSVGPVSQQAELLIRSVVE